MIGGVLADLLGMRLLFFGVGALATVTALLCAFVLHEPREHADASKADGPVMSQWDLLSDRPTLGMLTLLVLFQVMIAGVVAVARSSSTRSACRAESVATTTGMVIFVAGVPAMFISTAWARSARATASSR